MKKNEIPEHQNKLEGILLVDKQKGSTSFHLVSLLRKRTGIQKIGHAGTLDPFATGLMVMLIGREFTKKSDQFLNSEKQYQTTLFLGIATDSYDIDGTITHKNDLVPTLDQIKKALTQFQGEILQIPPMFSAKKVKGQKLYDLARKGMSIERAPVKVKIHIELLSYNYPHLELLVDCSKGTYIRSLGHDIGQVLNCGAHLCLLKRTKSGSFTLAQCISEEMIKNPNHLLEVFHV